MIKLLPILLIFIFISSSQIEGQIKNKSDSPLIYKLHYDSTNVQEAKQVAFWLEEGQQVVINFFNKNYKQKFDVYLFSQRDSLDKQWQKDWNMPKFKSRCWMVASGIAHRLDILSPNVWEDQACGHDTKDTVATKKIVIHEMIHVFHGQHNPSPTFENIDNIDWFVEGLAVYASGQLDKQRYSEVRKLSLREKGPTKLSKIWKGSNKYDMRVQ